MLNTTPIELKKKINLDCADDDAVLREAKKIDSRCELKTFYLKPGEFIIWSGRIWHETLNESNKVRQSIILQYCTPENKVKIPLNFEFNRIKGLSNEVRDILYKVRPESIAQASNLPGLTPTAILLLLRYVKHNKLENVSK